MQKTMKKLKTRNIRDETLQHVPYMYNKCYKLGKSKKTAMHHVITHIQEEVENSVV